MLLHCVHAAWVLCAYSANPQKSPITFAQHGKVATQGGIKLCCLQMCNKILHQCNDIFVDIQSYIVEADLSAFCIVSTDQLVLQCMNELAVCGCCVMNVLVVTLFAGIIYNDPIPPLFFLIKWANVKVPRPRGRVHQKYRFRQCLGEHTFKLSSSLKPHVSATTTKSSNL